MNNFLKELNKYIIDIKYSHSIYNKIDEYYSQRITNEKITKANFQEAIEISYKYYKSIIN